jgi:sulfoxide reductase heme-binding subunit YedZ
MKNEELRIENRELRAHNGFLNSQFSIQNFLRVAVHIGAWIPLALILFDFAADRLSVNPIQDITVRTGKTALVLLVLSLACTPLNTVFGFKPALKVRRALGLYGFMYIGLHLAVFAVLDYTLDWELIQQAIVEKRFVLAGFAAFLILTPLAITSTKGWQRRLGRNWKRLHKLVYIAVPIAIVHFTWLVKSITGRPEPLIWGAIVLMLLVLRLPAIRRVFSNFRSRAFANPATPNRPKQDMAGITALSRSSDHPASLARQLWHSSRRRR